MNQPQPPKPPAGWHDDGTGLRWWDGQAWTDIRPPSTGASERASDDDMPATDDRAAGWYDQDDGRQRYFDGAEWTEAYQKPRRVPRPPKPARPWVRVAFWGVVGVAIVALLASAFREDIEPTERSEAWQSGEAVGRNMGNNTPFQDRERGDGVRELCNYKMVAGQQDEEAWLAGCASGYRAATGQGE